MPLLPLPFLVDCCAEAAMQTADCCVLVPLRTADCCAEVVALLMAGCCAEAEPWLCSPPPHAGAASRAERTRRASAIPLAASLVVLVGKATPGYFRTLA